MKKLTFILLIVALAVSFFSPRDSAQASNSSASTWRTLNPAPNKIDPRLQPRLNVMQAGETLTVIVTLRQQANLSGKGRGNRQTRLHDVIQTLKNTADGTQTRLKKLLNTRRGQRKVKDFTPLWIINGFSVTATSEVINELAKDNDVLAITPDDLPIIPAYGTPETNISLVNAPALWDLGDTGQGVVVASLDSGVDLSHPDLAGRWRGGANSWYDPYGQHPASPVDLSGHGTWVTGVMVGGDAGGTSIGIAPGAQWIAVKIFNDAGSATATAIHQGFQWLLDPDGDPATDDAPQVVNNSWTYGNPGCNLEFELDLQSLRAAGILPVFAAGNGGPYANSSYSPANNPSAFAVGAITNNSTIYGYSSRGPSACSGSGLVYPEVVAPGVNIHTTDLLGGYTSATGTSLAAPHVAGILALLLSTSPDLSAADQENALISSAIDLGAAGPDNSFGYGRVDALAAYNWLASAPTATPTSAATATDTPLPATETPTALPPTETSTPLPPTATATPIPPTATANPSNTPTKTSTPVKIIHIGDLDRSTAKSGTKWNATVTILVHNANDQPLANATVTAKWTNGATGTVTCKTNASGICSITKTGLASTITSVTFTVTNVTLTGYTYSATLNHDPETDSNGTTIVVTKP